MGDRKTGRIGYRQASGNAVRKVGGEAAVLVDSSLLPWSLGFWRQALWESGKRAFCVFHFSIGRFSFFLFANFFFLTNNQ
jgi:hypothetical protein